MLDVGLPQKYLMLQSSATFKKRLVLKSMCLSPLQSYFGVSVLKCMMCIKCQHVCMRIGLFPGRGGDCFTNRPLSQVIGSSRMTVRYMRWQVAKMAEKKLISLPATLLFSLWWHVAFVMPLFLTYVACHISFMSTYTPRKRGECKRNRTKKIKV